LKTPYGLAESSTSGLKPSSTQFQNKDNGLQLAGILWAWEGALPTGCVVCPATALLTDTSNISSHCLGAALDNDFLPMFVCARTHTHHHHHHHHHLLVTWDRTRDGNLIQKQPISRLATSLWLWMSKMTIQYLSWGRLK
jgi:hypothetical protein